MILDLLTNINFVFLFIYIGTEQLQCGAEAGQDVSSIGCCENGDGYGTPPEEGEPKTEDKPDSEGSADGPCEGQQ